MGRPKRAAAADVDVEEEKSRREKAQKSYKEESDSAEEQDDEDAGGLVDPKDKDFSDDPSVSESDGSEWNGESSGSEYGKKKKKSPAKKGAVGGAKRGRKSGGVSASPKGRGRGRPPANKNGKKAAPAKRGRKEESDESEEEAAGSSGSEYGKKQVSPKKKPAPAKLSPRKKPAAAASRKNSSPAGAGEGRVRRGRPSKTYKEMSDDEADDVSEEEKPKIKRAKLEPKAKEKVAKEKDLSGSEDEEDHSMEDDEEAEREVTKKGEKVADGKKNGTSTSKAKVDTEESGEETNVKNGKDEDDEGSDGEMRDCEDDESPASEEEKEKVTDSTATALKNPTSTDYSKIEFDTKKKTPKGDASNFKIACWNVAGVKAWLKKNGMEYVKKENPDILCLNELKCNENTKPAELSEIDGYPHLYWSFNAENSGHNGVAIFSKIEAKSVQYGFPDDETVPDEKKLRKSFNGEGRMITVEFDEFYLINAYVPNSGRSENNDKNYKGYPPKVVDGVRQQFDLFLRSHVKELEKKKPVIVSGDLNVAHKEIDLANPKRNEKTAGFTKEEREGMTQFLEETTLFDSFRALYPDQKGTYSFWTYFRNSRAKNVGWRLDYFLISEKLRDSLCDSVIRTEVYGSDHCPIVLFLKK